MPYPSKTNRQTILLAAVEAVSQEGIRDLSMRHVASSLGLVPNALYRYFSDRAELEAAVANECARRLEKVLRSADKGAQPSEVLRKMSSAYVKFARNNRHLYEAMMSYHAPCHDASAYESLWSFTTEQVARVSGTPRAAEAAVALWALLHGAVALQAAQVFGKDKPSSGLNFGFEAWLSAASAANSNTPPVPIA